MTMRQLREMFGTDAIKARLRSLRAKLTWAKRKKDTVTEAQLRAVIAENERFLGGK